MRRTLTMTLAVGLGAGLAGLVLGLLTPASASTATSTTFGNVGPTSAVPATTYDPNLGGLLVGGHSIEHSLLTQARPRP
jgi:hypothetical protein